MTSRGEAEPGDRARPAAPRAPRKPARRTQAQRSAETRNKLLEAGVDCLIDRGYAGTTTLEVCRRAGVSHGALLHHYGTREALLAATLDHLYARLRASVIERLRELPDESARVEALVDLMWSVFGARPFKAVIELWLAAANEPGLRRRIVESASSFDAIIEPTATRLLPESARRQPDFAAYVSLLFQIMQGMGLAQAALRAAGGGDARQRVLDLTKRIIAAAFEPSSGAGPA
ncbi:MAG: TetR/AcrR family transcriptional regulator [Deltaproteobacteria bacterium]|nr:MAG: TetR/AcrR family transcriptional regulator [Deltaproteobacteria bacterium]